MTQRTLAVGRVWGLGVSLSIMLLALVAAVQAYRWNARFWQWFEDVPMRLQVDADSGESLEAKYVQTCEISHGAFLLVDQPVEPERYEAEAARYRGLQGTMRLVAADGKAGEAIAIGGKHIEYRLGRISLGRIPPARNGTYVADLSFGGDLQAWSTPPIKLIAKYELCGLENLPSQLLCWTAIGLATIGALALPFVLPIVYEQGFYRVSP